MRGGKRERREGGKANCNLSLPKICTAAAVMFKICRKYFLGKSLRCKSGCKYKLGTKTRRFLHKNIKNHFEGPNVGCCWALKGKVSNLVRMNMIEICIYSFETLFVVTLKVYLVKLSIRAYIFSSSARIRHKQDLYN